MTCKAGFGEIFLHNPLQLGYFLRAAHVPNGSAGPGAGNETMLAARAVLPLPSSSGVVDGAVRRIGYAATAAYDGNGVGRAGAQ